MCVQYSTPWTRARMCAISQGRHVNLRNNETTCLRWGREYSRIKLSEFTHSMASIVHIIYYESFPRCAHAHNYYLTRWITALRWELISLRRVKCEKCTIFDGRFSAEQNTVGEIENCYNITQVVNWSWFACFLFFFFCFVSGLHFRELNRHDGWSRHQRLIYRTMKYVYRCWYSQKMCGEYFIASYLGQSGSSSTRCIWTGKCNEETHK